MSETQRTNSTRSNGADNHLAYDDQPLTMAYLQAHPVSQFMLKRFEAVQIAASGPPLDEIEEFLGSGPIEYANWVRFDQKGRRIAWSQTVRRPKGTGWQPYTKPTRHPGRGKTGPGGDEPQNEQPPKTRNDAPANKPDLSIPISTPVTIKSPNVTIDGKPATVSVRTNAMLKRGEKDVGTGWVAFSVKMDGVPKNVHWIQWAKYDFYDVKGNKVEDHIFHTEKGGEKVDHLSGRWAVDTLLPPDKNKPENAFTTSNLGETIRNAGELTFVDMPKPRGAGEHEQFPKLLFSGDTFLVSGKGLQYRIQWEVQLDWDAKENKWISQTKILPSTGPVSSFPEGHPGIRSPLYGGSFEGRPGGYPNPIPLEHR